MEQLGTGGTSCQKEPDVLKTVWLNTQLSNERVAKMLCIYGVLLIHSSVTMTTNLNNLALPARILPNDPISRRNRQLWLEPYSYRVRTRALRDWCPYGYLCADTQHPYSTGCHSKTHRGSLWRTALQASVQKGEQEFCGAHHCRFQLQELPGMLGCTALQCAADDTRASAFP